MADSYVALLRGINVGGKNKLPMKDLASIFSKIGCADVATYIQSGNVIFKAPAKLAGGVAETVTKKIEAEFGLRVPVLLRSAGQLAKAIAGNLFLNEGVSEDFLHVAFLRDLATASLDQDRSPGDRFVVCGAEIYLHLPNGAARTKLTNAYFDSHLQTVSTMRNWRTVLKIAAMMGV